MMNTHDFLAGLICGKGSFICAKNGEKSLSFRFVITMHQRDHTLLKLLQGELGCGQINFYKSVPEGVVFVVANRKDIYTKVIPYFKYCLLGYKREQFYKWLDKFIEYHIKDGNLLAQSLALNHGSKKRKKN